jgi:tryptophan synthase beta chain
MADKTKYILDENEMPTAWYNINPDLPRPLDPPLGPDGNPVGP